MPLIRCDYSAELVSEEALGKLVKAVFDASAELCHLNDEDARNKISIFNTPFGPNDHSTATAEIEVRAKGTEFDRPGKTRQEVRAEWLQFYEKALLPVVQQAGFAAPIIFTITFEDWEVIVLSASGSVPN